MEDRVAAVVEGFKNLTDREKIVAYMEIDEVWKRLPRDEVEPKGGDSYP